MYNLVATTLDLPFLKMHRWNSGSDFEKKKAQHLLDLTRTPPKSS